MMCQELRIIILVFIGLAQLQNGILCYSCSSANSWKDCSSNIKEIYCSGSSTKCLKLRYNEGNADKVIYKKTCTVSGRCTRATRFECKNLGSAHECDVTCCSGDLCNGGSREKQVGCLLLVNYHVNAEDFFQQDNEESVDMLENLDNFDEEKFVDDNVMPNNENWKESDADDLKETDDLKDFKDNLEEEVNPVIRNIGAPIRLVNGGAPNRGRVEVYHNGSWGTVCDDSWDIRDANVVCRQLGLPPATSAPCCARFGQGSGRTWMDNVHCIGSERYLSQCFFRGWGREDCRHGEDAGVVCGTVTPTPPLSSISLPAVTPTPALPTIHPSAVLTSIPIIPTSVAPAAPIRLVNGGAPNQGRVEVYHNGRWGTVCDDAWGINDANVVCRQLGLPPATSAPCCARFGQGRDPTWMDNVHCTGSERYLSQCRFNGWGKEDCRHGEDAGVVCGRPVCGNATCYNGGTPYCQGGRPYCRCRSGFSGRQCETAVTPTPALPTIHPSAVLTSIPIIPTSVAPAAPIRLVNGGAPNQGRVEVYHNGRWGTVCDDAWDLNDANVVCRQLGLPPATSAPCCARFGQGRDPTWMDDVRCTGSERYLSQCRFNGWGREDCRHGEDAGVVCGRPVCDNATCYNGGTPYCQGRRPYCRCRSGFSGRQCETAVCRNIYCYNGGSRYCVSGQAYCRCPHGFTGRYCRTAVCGWLLRCYNGGTRYCRGRRAYCRCRPGFSGHYCQTAVCRNIYCHNRGSRYCVSGRAYCRCRHGFTGRYCQTGVCGWLRCYNGGIQYCRGRHTYCRCRFGYYGRQCQYYRYTTRRPWYTTQRPTRHPRLDILRILLKMLKGLTTLLDGIKDGIRAGISKAGARHYKREARSMLDQLESKADAIKDSSDATEINLLKDLGQVRERANVLFKQLDEIPDTEQSVDKLKNLDNFDEKKFVDDNVMPNDKNWKESDADDLKETDDLKNFKENLEEEVNPVIRHIGHTTPRPWHTTRRPWHTTRRHWHTTQRPWHTTRRHWHTTRRHWHTTQRPWHTTRRHWHTTRRPWHTTRRHWYTTQRPTRHPRLDILRILLKMLKGLTTLLDGIKDGIRAGISKAGARHYKREARSMLDQLESKADAIKDSSDATEINLLKDLGQVRERADVLFKQLDEIPEDKEEP